MKVFKSIYLKYLKKIKNLYIQFKYKFEKKLINYINFKKVKKS